MTYYSDDARHLVCVPYSVQGLHRMAEDLSLKRCWYHAGRWPHYDIPKRRIDEIRAKTTQISQRELFHIIKGAWRNS